MRDFLRGFKHAFSGIGKAIQQERNLRFHFSVAVMVYLFSLFYNFSVFEYLLVTILVAGVISLELVNSAIERIVDFVCPARNSSAGIIKDIAAGAVLVFSIAAAICGIILFWDIETFKNIFKHITENPLLLAGLLFMLLFCGWFVFGYNRKKEK